MGVPAYICFMFVRKKSNPSGIVSVQIIDKSGGRYEVVKTVGSSADPAEIERLVSIGKEMITRMFGQQVMDFRSDSDERFLSKVKESLQKIQLLGPELILGRIFDEVGFNQVPEELFRHLVISRLVFPLSKLKTIDYLQKYSGIYYEIGQIYRYLDKFRKGYFEQVQAISFRHTLEVLGGDLSVVFYDVTTLYFEADREDDFRIAGFSKEGKHKHPQILVGLLVGVHGYPLAYELFEGNKFEGHTMIPVLEAFKQRYQLKKLVVIADSGLLSKKNVGQLQEGGYEFILGARLKQEPERLKRAILGLGLENGQCKVLDRPDGLKLVISHSAKRAGKDQYNRERGLKRLEKDLSRGKITKASLNNRGYNKFLKMEGEVSVSLDLDQVEDDKKWDGLKGYLTNCDLAPDDIIANYRHLWQIEQAFRISKTDLKVRPVYHYTKRRIETHICISFCAYKLYKELERKLKLGQSKLSPARAIEAMSTIYGVQLILPQSKEPYTHLIADHKDHRELRKIFEF